MRGTTLNFGGGTNCQSNIQSTKLLKVTISLINEKFYNSLTKITYENDLLDFESRIPTYLMKSKLWRRNRKIKKVKV